MPKHIYTLWQLFLHTRTNFLVYMICIEISNAFFSKYLYRLLSDSETIAIDKNVLEVGREYNLFVKASDSSGTRIGQSSVWLTVRRPPYDGTCLIQCPAIAISTY